MSKVVIDTNGLIEQAASYDKDRSLTAKKQFMFTKVGRTASESMHQQLSADVRGYLRLGRIQQLVEYYGKYKKPKHNLCHNHIPIRSMIAGRIFDSAWYSSLYKWGGCRNPWDRLVSLWRIKESEQRSAGIATKCNTFEDLVSRLEQREGVNFTPESNKYSIMQPQWRWLLPEFDYITRYEHLKDDWAAVTKALGIPQLSLTKHNTYHKQKDTSKRRDYKSYYTDRLARRVGILYKQDCAIFGYADIDDLQPYDQAQILSNLQSHWAELGYTGPS